MEHRPLLSIDRLLNALVLHRQYWCVQTLQHGHMNVSQLDSHLVSRVCQRDSQCTHSIQYDLHGTQ
jgi:hypothetical protein